MIVVIPPGGNVTAIAHAECDNSRLKHVGDIASVRRGGHVLPAPVALRVLFRLLRSVPRDPLAAWTRTWPCAWVVDLAVSGGPVLGPYYDRASAVRAEEEYLAQTILAAL